MPPGPSSKEVCATTRTWPLNCIASAKAVRISCTVSSIESMSTWPVSSVMVTRMPGPVTGTTPARISRVWVSRRASSSAACSALLSSRRSSRVSSSRAISASARWVVPESPSRTSISACWR